MRLLSLGLALGWFAAAAPAEYHARLPTAPPLTAAEIEKALAK